MQELHEVLVHRGNGHRLVHVKLGEFAEQSAPGRRRLGRAGLRMIRVTIFESELARDAIMVFHVDEQLATGLAQLVQHTDHIKLQLCVDVFRHSKQPMLAIICSCGLVEKLSHVRLSISALAIGLLLLLLCEIRIARCRCVVLHAEQPHRLIL
jgi:hypothetical protein